MITTHRRDGFAADIKIRMHMLLSDVSAKLGGKDSGPSPHDLLEAALGACTTITVQMYAERKGWKLTSCDAAVKFIREDKESIVIERVITFQGELDDDQKKRLFEIAEKCPVHEVLTRGTKVESRYT